MGENTNNGLVGLKEFLYYCRDCFSNGRGIPIIDPEPLAAALIKEKLLLPVATVDGEELFSKHQIAMLVRHMRNVVGEDGLLHAPRSVERERQGRARNVALTGGPVLALSFANGAEWEAHLLEAKKFRDALSLLHAQEAVLFRSEATVRYWNASPTLDYDLSGVTGGTLSEAGLSTTDLTAQRALWGGVADEIDPLVSWRPFVERIPRWRRDQLKGDARLAQEAYDVTDLLGRMLAAATGAKQEPLSDLIHAGMPAPDGRVEYAFGYDPAAVRRAVGLARGWLAKDENKRFDVTDEKDWEAIESALSEYGAQDENTIPLPDNLADGQLDETQESSIKRHLKERKLMKIIDSVFGREGSLMARVNEAIDKELSELEAQRNAYHGRAEEFWSGNYLAEKCLYDKRREQNGLERAATMVLCARCRKNPVTLTRRNQFSGMSPEDLLCRQCVGAMRDPTGEKLGEWTCVACGKVLQKFAHSEVLRGTTLNKNPMEVRLTYGEAVVEITCTGDRHKPCGHVNRRAVEFGWTPPSA